MGITPGMMIGGLGAIGSLAGLFGNNQPSNVQLPQMQQFNLTPYANQASSAIGNLGQYNIGGNFIPQANQTVGNLYNNPYAGGYQGGAGQFGGLGMGAGLSAIGAGSMMGGTMPGLIGAAGAELQAGFDPQNALYARTAQQVSDQSLAGLAGSGLATTPWGQGVYGNTMSNFNIDWQNNLLNRMNTAGQGASGLVGAAGGAGMTGLNLGAGGMQLGMQGAGLPWSTYGQIGGAQLGAIGQGTQLGNQMAQIPGMQASDYLSQLGAMSGINQQAQGVASLGLQQQQQGFNQEQAYGRNLGGSLAMMTGAVSPQQMYGWGGQRFGPQQPGYYQPGGYASLQSGGPAEEGKPYLIGEKGPELFVPDSSGHVIPNHELGGLGGLDRLGMSDASPDPMRAGSQYAAMPPKRAIPESQLESGQPLAMSSRGGSSSAKSGELLGPKGLSTEGASLRDQYRELQKQEMALMRLRPMVPVLIKLGVTPQQMVKMNPTEAYQFIKRSSPQGMGKIDKNEDKMVGDIINQLNSQRRSLADRLLGSGE